MWISDVAIDRLRSVADAPDFAGTRYRVVREIARGGMGVIYEAEDTVLRRHVAVKVLAVEISSAAAVQRMRAEAETMARLEHPGIVPVHDAGELPDGRVFYAMKLVRGNRLDEYAAAHDLRDLLRVFLRICEAVAFAHARGVVHRDLNPHNIMVGEFGEVLVMDWGVAVVAGAEPEESGTVVGTRGFMAPEQERGDVAGTDAAADIFALGAILRELAARHSPSKALEAICRTAMAPRKEDRYPSVAPLAADVLAILDDAPVTVYRENAIERFERWIGRNRALIAIVGAYLLMRVIVFLVVRR